MQSTKPVCEKLKEGVSSSFISSTTKNFIPKASVQQLLDRDAVDQVLLCRCWNCCIQGASDRQHSTRTIRDWIFSSSRQLFALLIYASCPQLIDGFFQNNCDDCDVDRYLGRFTVDYISTTFWSWLHSKDRGRSNYLAKQVADHKYQFFVPILEVCDAQNIQRFDPEVVIPITKESQLDQGYESRVFAIQIPDGYHKFPLNDSTSLVRKEVNLSSRHRQSEELDILLQAQRLQDNGNPVHIVQLISAYVHGETINYIFPRATTNLYKYFRTKDSHYHQPGLFRTEKHPLWKQILGILRALHLLHSDVYQTSSGKQIKVYHFDLKPANILVDISHDTVRLLIADFGFSRSRIATGTRYSESRLTGYGGTAAYAPPEMINIHNQRTHRYDVWSLGCILLEICAFIVGGQQGVLDLDNARYTDESTPDNEIEDDLFWHISPLKQAELKPSVVEWMRKLPHSRNVDSGNVSAFLEAVLGLVREMLNVDVNKRIDAETAQAKLNSILQRVSQESFVTSNTSFGASFQSGSSTRIYVKPDQLPNRTESDILTTGLARSGSSSRFSFKSGHSIMPPTETSARSSDGLVSIGVTELQSLGNINCKYGVWYHDNVRLQFYEDGLRMLHIRLQDGNNTLREIDLGSRDSVHMVTVQSENKACRLEVHPSARKHACFKALNFYMDNVRDMAMLQSVLLGQCVRSFSTVRQRSLRVTSLKIEEHRRGLRYRSSSSNRPVSSDDWGRPLSLELWSQKSYHDPEALQRIMPRRKSRSLAVDVPTRRLVIFCQKALLLVKFAKNARLAKPAGKSPGLTHKMIHTDQRKNPKDPSFPVAVLAADMSGNCRIPLDSSALDELHVSSFFECTSLEFGLESREDWDIFMKKYNNMKMEWAAENAELDEDLKFGAEKRGWGISM